MRHPALASSARFRTLIAAVALAACTACTGGASNGRSDASDDAELPDGAIVDGSASPADLGPDVADEPVDPFALPAAVPLEALRDGFGRARCAFDARCGVGFADTEPDVCIRVAGGLAWHVEAVERMHALGRLAYDPATMAECLDWLAARPCASVGRVAGVADFAGGRDYFVRDADVDWAAFEPCRAALVGDGVGGDGCVHNIECQSLTCEGAETLSCGTCMAVDSPDCSAGRCPDELRCDYDTGACLPRLGEGEACVNDAWCTAALRCDRPGAELGVCVGLGPVGRPCDDANINAGLCPVGSICLRGTCVDLPLRFAGEGEPCGREPDAPQCRPDLYCDSDDDGASFTCRTYGEGADCGYAERTPSPLSRIDRCAEGFVCDEAEVCALPGDVGDGCRGSRDCANPLFCEPESSTCQVRLGMGEICSAYPAGSECAYPLNCVGSRIFNSDDGTCEAGARLGEVCEGKEDCAPELNCSDAGGTERCYFYASSGSSYFGCR